MHQGQAILVCGCGESLNELAAPEGLVTIGVNDVGRLLQPDYLVVVNPRRQFTGDRFRYVETSRAKVLFTQLDLGVDHPSVVRFRLGRHGGTDFGDPNVLHYTQNSPYVAVCLAVHMGAERIGLVGVDFTDHHFFGPTGRHALAGSLERIDREYAQLAAALAGRGVELVNLSARSRLTALPKLPLATFAGSATARAPRPTRALSVASYATTPIAGVPAILARCIDARTPHSARCVWARKDYGNGVVFDGDIEWSGAPAAAERALEAADLVIVHNGKVDARHRALLAGKPVVTMAHNYLWNVDQGFVERGFPGAVVGQYQAALPEFREWAVVPNPLPFWEKQYRPGLKGPEVTICYTPSGRHERYSPGHRLYWHAKGYVTTMAVLERVARRWPLRLEVIRERQIAHAEALAMKRRAHIVIDECVTGSYHRNSLEGLAAGCVVVNAVGLMPEVCEILRRCGGGSEAPFVRATLDDLEEVLEQLIRTGAEELAARGAAGRRWIEEHWNWESQWPSFWLPLLDQALGRTQPTAPRTSAPGANGNGSAVVARPPGNAAARIADGGEVSVVIPHGGEHALRHLATTLEYLRRSAGALEIVVADLGERPSAEGLAGRWGCRYAFEETAGAFERARALNVGSAPASSPLVLWLDNDLLVGPDFIRHAADEMRAQRGDFLLPYSQIAYLSEADTEAVMAGRADPAGCRPAKVLRSGFDILGGAGLVSRGFLDRHGGLCEEFKGWGGEDNAWWHKVSVLGRAGWSRRPEQVLHHLYHPRSGAHVGTPAAAANPHYDRNLKLLYEIRTLRTPAAFLKRFPPMLQPQQPGAQSDIPQIGRSTALAPSVPSVRNVYACLVHERRDCVVDLVQNLRTNDPESSILLYNGGEDAALLAAPSPFERLGAIVHPAPRPQKWGSLHNFALDSLRFALDHLSFDTLTVVDSDQLLLRPGYTARLAHALEGRSGVGLLCSSPGRQPKGTIIQPAAQAWREIELWRPLLRQFPGGEEKFVHWTFWPATVFTREGARDLIDFWDHSKMLSELVARSRIWATEEVILPTLLALLGHRVEANPCCGDYVHFRRAFTPPQLEAALARKDVFWIHPVPRRYEDPLRRALRKRWQGRARLAPEPRPGRPGLLLVKPILDQMKAIEGWFEEDEADLLIATAARALRDLAAPRALVEIGSFCGRSTVVLGSVAKVVDAAARVHAIDPHDGRVGAADAEVRQLRPTLQTFRRNVAAAGLSAQVVEHVQRSWEVAWDGPIALLFIDGLHDYQNVGRDFRHFEPWVVPGGYVAFHDYADYYPGVQALVEEVLLSGCWREVARVRSLIVLCKEGGPADPHVVRSH